MGVEDTVMVGAEVGTHEVEEVAGVGAVAVEMSASNVENQVTGPENVLLSVVVGAVVVVSHLGIVAVVVAEVTALGVVVDLDMLAAMVKRTKVVIVMVVVVAVVVAVVIVMVQIAMMMVMVVMDMSEAVVEQVQGMEVVGQHDMKGVTEIDLGHTIDRVVGPMMITIDKKRWSHVLLYKDHLLGQLALFNW